MKNQHADVAAELLRSLFSGRPGYKPKQHREEWACQKCGTHNYLDRKSCRRCSAQATNSATKPAPSRHVTKPALKTSSTQPPALASWATREMIESREASLTAALEATKACEGCDTAVQNIESELKGLRKRTAEPPSIHKSIDTTRAFIGRAEKRHQHLVSEVSAAQELERAAFHELDDARKRLQQMEAEAREALSMPPPPPANASDALADAVRTLMVVMHKFNLPAHVGEAMSSVVQCLPQEPPSEDYAEEPCVDEAIGVDAANINDSDTAMDELEAAEGEDDVALLAIARRLKRARRTGPRARSRSRSDH